MTISTNTEAQKFLDELIATAEGATPDWSAVSSEIEYGAINLHEQKHIATFSPALILPMLRGWKELLELHHQALAGGHPICGTCLRSYENMANLVLYPCPTVSIILSSLSSIADAIEWKP